VTRAKWECVLVTSLRSEQLSGVNPENRGAMALRAFMEYAERKGELPAAPSRAAVAETNDFENAVRAALGARGFAVDAQVGAGRYRIDLAVRDSRDPNRYLLGIECDGAAYRSSRTARDRDILRQEVLARMGWSLHRVWSTEWFHHPERVLEGILRSIEQAGRVPGAQPVVAPAVPAPTPAPTPQPETKRRYPAGVPYHRVTTLRGARREMLMDTEYAARLAEMVAEVAAVEGPVHRDVLVERLKDLNSVERAGSNVQANIEAAIEIARQSARVTLSEEGAFLHAPGAHLGAFRMPSDGCKRSIDEIAVEELELAILHLVEDQFGVLEEHIPHAAARLFGVERLRPESTGRIEKTIEGLLNRGLLRRSGSQIHLG
jgi:very-short-patch-repair endonuclease